ncbi:hypothetical protein AKJ39_01840 [candidate division MSBL1 archaeon SCGC-AAA259J03]|uniref:Uncharacterized protein n=1 Tax=candidate division MSBL1 archaeon SCGC-AAA259J03 TaxID=1698269 RepID=A0A656YX72_9EURY|nr:hypothetical protein AKJ39_01840 [candidate division MSBL1 archaeon SCGC-AAA259J03]
MEEGNRTEEGGLLDSDGFRAVVKVADGVPRRFLNWNGYPAVIGLVTAAGTTLDLHRTLSIYFSDPQFFMWAEQGFLARFLIPRAWHLFVAWEWFLVGLAVYLSTRESIIVRVWGFVIALPSIMTPLMWYSAGFHWLTALAGWMAIPPAKTLAEKISNGPAGGAG